MEKINGLDRKASLVSKDYLVKDIKLAALGQKKIDWVAKWMRVLNRIFDKYSKTKSFKNKRITLCIHLEAKTAYLALNIKKLGAEVWITSSNPLSTKDDICAALAIKGVHVFALHGASQKEYNSFLKAIVKNKPHVVVDDGGDVCELLSKYRECGRELKGIGEETTTGVVRLKELAKQ